MLRVRSFYKIKSIGLTLLRAGVVTLVRALGDSSVNLLGSLDAPQF